jgi:hypothetical protein
MLELLRRDNGVRQDFYQHRTIKYRSMWACVYVANDIRTYCDGMPESRNSGIGSEVNFLGNELLRRLDEYS